MERCMFLGRMLSPANDGKMHFYYFCRNTHNSNHKKYSIDRCSICNNCLECTNSDEIGKIECICPDCGSKNIIEYIDKTANPIQTWKRCSDCGYESEKCMVSKVIIAETEGDKISLLSTKNSHICTCFRQEYGKSVCYGTKEREECVCKGDKSKCDFY